MCMQDGPDFVVNPSALVLIQGTPDQPAKREQGSKATKSNTVPAP